MKMDHYTDRLLHLLDGTLEPDVEAQLRSEINQSVELQEELSRLQALRGLLQDSMKASSDSALRPFFTDRLMKQLEPEHLKQIEHDDIAFFLTKLFRPVAVAGFIVAMFFAVYNVNISGDFASETTTAEAILGLPPVNTLSVYDLDLFVEEDPTTPSSNP